MPTKHCNSEGESNPVEGLRLIVGRFRTPIKVPASIGTKGLSADLAKGI